MNGAEGLIQTLVESSVDTCFMNPGTSEMHFVAALDRVPAMRGVLGLFEGVVTGAADGYGRMAERPAATLLHLGPGLANGLANLHNARRADSPIVNVVGDHATYHKALDAPLESDIEALAGTVSSWVGRATSPADLAELGAEAVRVARGTNARIATVIAPADTSWEEGGRVAPMLGAAPSKTVAGDVVDRVAAVLSSDEPCVILLGGSACRAAGLIAASRVSAATGAAVYRETFPARMAHGAGLPHFERFAYLAESALEQLAGAKHIILVGASPPVSFFAYPGIPGDLVPDGCLVHQLATVSEDVVEALVALADVVAHGVSARVEPVDCAMPQDGSLTPVNVAAVIAAFLPEGAIISDEAATAGYALPHALRGAPPHDWLTLTGGAIGQGMPVATGAAVACPDRKVVSVQADGSAMFTIQSLWTQAREQLDVTTIIFNNRSYAILKRELARVGASGGGERSSSMLELSNPGLTFSAIAEGMGVPATSVGDVGSFATALDSAMRSPGPHLIDVDLLGS